MHGLDQLRRLGLVASSWFCKVLTCTWASGSGGLLRGGLRGLPLGAGGALGRTVRLLWGAVSDSWNRVGDPTSVVTRVWL
jgi:hypothetical protein